MPMPIDRFHSMTCVHKAFNSLFIKPPHFTWIKKKGWAPPRIHKMIGWISDKSNLKCNKSWLNAWWVDWSNRTRERYRLIQKKASALNLVCNKMNFFWKSINRTIDNILSKRWEQKRLSSVYKSIVRASALIQI